MEPALHLKIDCISDTHGQHRALELPGGDVLIHAGDATMQGAFQETMLFLEWLKEQKYTYKVFVPGNHDWLAENDPALLAKECKDRDIILLNDSGVEIEGVKFWGSPVQPTFFDWAFNRDRGEDIRKHWDLIPEDTQVLITHGPPFDMLDVTPRNEKVGCQDLLLKILQTKIKLHVFGHIHEGGGYKYYDERLFVNASTLNGRYRFRPRGYITVFKVENDFFADSLTPFPESAE